MDLNLDWARFTRAFGKEAAAAHEASKASSLKKRRRNNTGIFTTSVRLALKVRPSWARLDNQEPLGTRAPLFDTYLSLLGKRIEPLFNSYLIGTEAPMATLHRKVQEGPLRHNPFYVPPPKADLAEIREKTPFADQALRTLTELEILRSGALGEVRLVRTSGNELFDAIVLASIFQGSPFPPPPDLLVSGNDRTYLRLAFFRDPDNHGTLRSSGYILSTTGPVHDAAVSAD